jgi:hypothetical protein
MISERLRGAIERYGAAERCAGAHIASDPGKARHDLLLAIDVELEGARDAGRLLAALDFDGMGAK